MHTVSCLHLLCIQGFHTDPNAYAGDCTNFSLSIAEAENIQSEAIHNAQHGGLNRETSFIWLEAEINGRRVREATGIVKWLKSLETEMGYVTPIPNKETIVN